MLNFVGKILFVLLLAASWMPSGYAAADKVRTLPRYKVELAPGVILELVYLKGGTFFMGSPDDELGRWASWGEKQRKVVITRPYYIAVYETTQEQFTAVMKYNPSYFKGKNLPVNKLSWRQAMEFCNRLNRLTEKTRPENYRFSLPTEAQWEYACRAGTDTALNNNKNLTDAEYCKNLDDIAWYMGNSRGVMHPVGQKKPNRWGLYDMHGNAWEYCLDPWTSKPDPRDMINPRGPEPNGKYVKKGGGYYLPAKRCRSAARSNIKNDAPHYISFRVALVYSPDKPAKKQP